MQKPAASWLQVHGTPGETRTHYLTLRRRTLYPGELRGQIPGHCTEKIGDCQPKPLIFS